MQAQGGWSGVSRRVKLAANILRYGHGGVLIEEGSFSDGEEFELCKKLKSVQEEQ